MAWLGWTVIGLGDMPWARAVVNHRPGQPRHPLLVSLTPPPGNRHDAVAYPDLLVKPNGWMRPLTDHPHHPYGGDAAFDVNALWRFTRERGVVPVFAPLSPVAPVCISPAATAAGIALDNQPEPAPLRGRPRPHRPGAKTPGHHRLGLSPSATPACHR
ncbi:MAG: hypothetical protein M0Z53_12290 [Thermaerobacter sp.]|nr:hypothetical protein [Thermaerobacter sp.]